MYQSRIQQSKSRKSRNNKNRELLEPEDGQDYAIVQDMLGNGRIRVFCSDKELRIARIRGSMRKYGGKVIIERNDLVMVAFRDFDSTAVDVFHKFNHDEIAYMTRHGMLPDVISKKLQMGDQEEWKNNPDDNVVFMEEDEHASDDQHRDGQEEQEEVDIDNI